MSNVIRISVSGRVQTGKSAVLQSIRDMLDKAGYCVAIPERAERNDPSLPLHQALAHEKPDPDATVFVLTEQTNDR